MRFERREQPVNPFGKAIVDYALVLQCFDLVSAPVTFLVNLCLFGADEGFLVDIGVDLDVAVVGELEGVLSSRK